jgi:polyisoprenyl-phosphate glycosyltransferase
LIGLSIEGLTSFSVAPLRMASLLGVLLAAGALVFGIEIMIETFIYGKSVPGYPSLVVSLMVLGGVQLIMIGVLGEYIGKLLSEIKARPVYFVSEHRVQIAKESAKESAKPRPAASRAAE